MAKKKNKQHHEVTAIGAGAFGANASSSEAAASDAMREGMARFLEESGKNTPADQLKGNLFEYIEVARFNKQAALQGSQATARVTAADGRPHAPADIEIIEGHTVVNRVQSKVSNDPSYLSREQADPKYRGMDRLVPQDKADATRLHSEMRAETLLKEGDPRAEDYQDSSSRIEGELRHREASSGGTTAKELEFASEYPKLFAALEEGGALAQEAHKAGLHGAGAAAVLGGAISIGRNMDAYSKGELEGKEAAVNIAADIGKTAVRGYSTAATGSGIRHVAAKAGLPTLAKSNVAIPVAAALIETGVVVYDYMKGEISAGEAAERIGSTGCSTLASIYTGAAAGAVFGPVGAVVGTMAGYMVTTWVYQSCIAIMRNARLAEEEAARVVALCEQAVRSLDQQRESFESALNERLNEKQARFDGLFKEIDEALVSDRTDDAILALSGLVASCGQELGLVNFEEFDAFMLESDTPLTI